MAVAALLIWLCTAAVGSYLLATAVQSANAGWPADTGPEPEEPASVLTEQHTAAGPGAGTVPAAAAPAAPLPETPVLGTPTPGGRRAPTAGHTPGSEPLPVKALAEFAHPALAVIGLGFWFGYVVSRHRLFAVIGLGILLGAICAGVTWFTINTRAARRAAAADAAPAPAAPGTAPLIGSPVLLTLHAVGAALTLLFAVLIAVGG